MNKILKLELVLSKMSLFKEANFLATLRKTSQEMPQTYIDNSWIYHTIVSGDSIEKISKKYYNDTNPNIIKLILSDNNLIMDEETKNVPLKIGNKIKLRKKDDVYRSVGLFNINLKASSKIRDTIKSIEKYKSKPYIVDGTKDYLVYYGHNLKTSDPTEAKKRASQKTADQFFEEDIRSAEGIISRIPYIRYLEQNEFDALVSISYSIGYLPDWFKESLQRDTAARSVWVKDIADKILKILPENKKIDAGILERRKIERDVFLNNTYFSSSK